MARLPPGKDHVHQVVFIVLSLVGPVVTAGRFLARRDNRNEGA